MYTISESMWKILEECIENNLGNIQSEFNREDIKGFKRKKKSSPWNKEMDPSPDGSVKNNNPSETFDTSGESSGETPSKNNSTDSTSTLKNNETLESPKSSFSLSSSSPSYTSTPKDFTGPIKCPIRWCNKPKPYKKIRYARQYLPKHLSNTHNVKMTTVKNDNDKKFIEELEAIKIDFDHKKSPTKSNIFHTPQSSPGKTSSPSRSSPSSPKTKRRRFANADQKSSQSLQPEAREWIHN